MYPTLELLLRHAIQFLGLRGKSVVSEPGVLDNVEDFLKDLQDCSAQTAKLANLAENITKDDQVVVLSVLLLALVLDGESFKQPLSFSLSVDGLLSELAVCTMTRPGNIGRQEKKLWKAACAACDPATAEYYPKRLVHLSTLFREFQAITVSAHVLSRTALRVYADLWLYADVSVCGVGCDDRRRRTSSTASTRKPRTMSRTLPMQSSSYVHPQPTAVSDSKVVLTVWVIV